MLRIIQGDDAKEAAHDQASFLQVSFFDLRYGAAIDPKLLTSLCSSCRGQAKLQEF